MNEKNPGPNFEKNTESENGSSWDEMANSMPSFQEHMKGVKGRIDEAYAKLERKNVEKRKDKIRELYPVGYSAHVESSYYGTRKEEYNGHIGYVPSTGKKFSVLF